MSGLIQRICCYEDGLVEDDAVCADNQFYLTLVTLVVLHTVGPYEQLKYRGVCIKATGKKVS